MSTAMPNEDDDLDADAPSQDAAIAFLSDPKSYDPPVERVTRVDTHGAIVFLAGERAYKIKRAVRYPYLDFSTLDKRRLFCKCEIMRNAAAAPEIYIAAVPIVRNLHGRLALNEKGEPIEWVVVMNRFDQADLFDSLAQSGKLSIAHVSALADTIAEQHTSALPCDDFDSDRWFEETVSPVVAKLSGAMGLINLDDVKYFSRLLLAHQNANRSLLRERAQNGCVRLCHGDLHLKNVVLWRGQPTLFDAIEFDDDIATQDVLYDLSFVLMDLLSRDLKQQACVLFNRYLWRADTAGDLSCLAALPLFMSIRAAIRAMICLDRLPFVHDERTETQRELRNYFDLACALLKDSTPCLIAIGGRSGSGKSTLSQAIAPSIGRAPGGVHLRSDVERKKMFGASLEDRLGEEAYDESVSDVVYDRLIDTAGSALKAGQSVIVDAMFLSPVHRDMIEKLGEECKVAFVGVWLDAKEDLLLSRVNKRVNDASDADAAVVRGQFTTDPGSINWRVISSDAELNQISRDVLAIIKGAMRGVIYSPLT